MMMLKQLVFLLLASAALSVFAEKAENREFQLSETGVKEWLSPRYQIDHSRGTELVIDWEYLPEKVIPCESEIIWLNESNQVLFPRSLPQPQFMSPDKRMLGTTLSFRQTADGENIPPSARYFQLKMKLLTAPSGNPGKGGILFQPPRISWRPVVVSRTPYHWFEWKKPVRFSCRLNGEFKLRGIVTDFEGAAVADHTCPAENWEWNPPRPGFYSVRFFLVAADGKEKLLQQEVLHSLSASGLGSNSLVRQIRIPRDHRDFVVAEGPARPAYSDPESPFGSNATSYASEWLGRQLDVIKLMNISSAVRYHWFRWNLIERSPGNYDWSSVDSVLKWAEAKGFPQESVLLNTFGTPEWNSTRITTNRENAWADSYFFYAPKDLRRWGNFLRAFSKRYPRIRMWELWNEPHLNKFSLFWQGSTPERFVELLQTGYEALKSVNPDNIVISGGIGMNYIPFYEEFLKHGGNRWCDRTGTHNVYDAGPFREAEKKYRAASHPLCETEWHTNLVNCREEKFPSEQELSFRMLVNLAGILTQNPTRILAFYPFCGIQPEAAEYEAGMPGIRQICGLFRTQPAIEPRHQAFALRVAADRFQGRIRHLGAWNYAQRQTAAAFESGKGKVLLFWSSAENANPPDMAPPIRKALEGKTLLDWEGRPVTWKELRHRQVYYGIDPDLAAAASGGEEISTIPPPNRKRESLDRSVSGHYAPLARPHWNELKTYVSLDGISRRAEKFSARYALEMNRNGMEILVEVEDERFSPAPPDSGRIWNFDSVQFAVDSRGRGDSADVLEFIAGANNRLIKLSGPDLGGDLPAEYSEPGREVRHGKVDITRRQERTTTYRISLTAADLYPFVPREGIPLRFSLLVNDNNGNGREGYLEWGTGIGGIKSAAGYGTLHVPAARRVAADQSALRNAFQEAVVTPGEIASVQASPKVKEAFGIKAYTTVTPGARYRISGEICGTSGKVEVMCFGDGMPRQDLEEVPAGPGWRRFSGEVVIPEKTSLLHTVLFVWKQPEMKFRVRNFRIEGL